MSTEVQHPRWEPDERNGWVAGVGVLRLRVVIDLLGDEIVSWEVSWDSGQLYGSAETIAQAKAVAIVVARAVRSGRIPAVPRGAS